MRHPPYNTDSGSNVATFLRRLAALGHSCKVTAGVNLLLSFLNTYFYRNWIFVASHGRQVATAGEG